MTSDDHAWVLSAALLGEGVWSPSKTASVSE